MPKNICKLFLSTSLLVLISLIYPTYIQALTIESDYIASSSATITATVPSTGEPILDTTPPNTPILIAPPDGTVTPDNTPEFIWTRVTDPNSNVVNYTLYLNNIANYIGVENDGNTIHYNYTALVDSGQIILTPLVELPDGEYEWFVEAYDLAGNTATSVRFTFTIDTTSPPINITDIDKYHDLSLSTSNPGAITSDTSFETRGPKDIYFTIESEPYAELQLSFFESSGYSAAYTSTTANSSGIANPYQYLEPGIYTVQVVAVDQASNTSALPTFTIIITKLSITIPPLPGITEPIFPPTEPEAPTSPTKPTTPPIEIVIPPLPSLPATVARITKPTLIPYYLLIGVIFTVILFILLKKKRYNLLLIDESDSPIHEAIIYHSLPPKNKKTSLTDPTYTSFRSKPSGNYTRLELNNTDKGKLKVPKLSIYSTLTINIESSDYKCILSLCRKKKSYTIKLPNIA